MKAIICTVLLEKTARHMGLVACLCILFNASERTDFSQGVVMFLVAGASALHLLGRHFKRRDLSGRKS